MPNSAVRAAAEGLPAINRRILMTGAGAALVSTPVAAMPAHAGQSVAHENSALLSLGVELDAAIAELEAAKGAEDAAVSHYGWIAPELPADLILPRRVELRFCEGECEEDVLGRSIRSATGPSRRIMCTWNLERAAKIWPEADYYPGEEIHRLLPIARAYEAACDDAKIKAGVEDASDRYWRASRAVETLDEKIQQEAALGAAGLRIKARAALVCAALLYGELTVCTHPRWLSLAQAILSMGSDAHGDAA